MDPDLIGDDDSFGGEVTYLRRELDPDYPGPVLVAEAVRPVSCSMCGATGSLGPLPGAEDQRRWDSWAATREGPPPPWAILTWRATGAGEVWRERVDLRFLPLARDCGRHPVVPAGEG
jgi:hypothetical protein